MKSSNQKITQKPKAPCSAIHRITALLLALLLTAATLSPTITASAAEITENDSDRDSGGHQTGGDGESTQRPTHNPDDDTTITTNEDGTRTLTFSQKIYHLAKDPSQYGTYDQKQKHKYTINGKGKFVIVGYYNSKKSDDLLGFASYILSNNAFTVTDVYNLTLGDYIASPTTSTCNAALYKGVYYCSLSSLVSGLPNEEWLLSGFMNERQTNYSKFEDALKADIDNMNIDLSKDDYISDEQIADMEPVRDDSIGYLPRARYFDNRNDSELSFDYYNDYTATIQWDSFQEPYSTDLDNPYYIEIYAQIHYKLGNVNNTSSVKMIQYKKYGDVKYVAERFVFPHREPADTYLLSIGAHLWSKIEGLNPDSDMAIAERSIKHYYVRLVHYDYDKQQLLCGGWTRLTLDDNGGCTSEPGDFDPDNEDDWMPEDPDKDPDKWDDTGDEKDPSKPDKPDNPDDPDYGIDTSSIGAFIISAITSLLNAIKSILSLVGEFPDLIRHVFSFLPDEIFYMMFLGTSAIVVMRFLGR